MSLKLGTQDISGISQNTKYNAHHLLDFKWTDCIMNDVSWLRADTFSWQSGDVYTSAYNHLVADLQGTTAETETIGSYTVTFYRADDGHKICLADQETTVLNIYNESGIAWYYIVDTVNTQFKLPRTKFGFEGVRTNVGDLIEAGLPNITGAYNDTRGVLDGTPTGAFSGTYNKSGTGAGYSNIGYISVSFDASDSNSIYGNSTTVQSPATQMYLYFYVGDYTQTAIEQTAGLNSGLFNGKADVDLSNMSASQSAKNTIVSWGMPDYSAGIDLSSYTSSSNQFTAPCDGVINWGHITTGKGYLNNAIVNSWASSTVYAYSNVFLPLHKGDKWYADVYSDTSTICNKFFPLKGAN